MPTLYTSQSISAAGGQQLNPVSTTLTKSLVALHVKLTTGASLPTLAKGVLVNIAATAFAPTAAEAAAKLHPSYILYCEPAQAASGVAYFKSEPIIIEGTTLYAWLNADALGAAITLDATITEIA